MSCRHCGHVRVNRPRGLCWVCYYTPGVRDRYGPVSKYGHRGSYVGVISTPVAELPTPAMPGPDKVAVLIARAERGVSLWHPQDATYGDQS